MSTVLVIPTDGNEQDKLLEVIQRWVKFYQGQLSKVVLVGAVGKLEGPLARSNALERVETPQHQRRPRLNQQRALHTLLEDAPDDVDVIWTHDDIFLTKDVTFEQLVRLSMCSRRLGKKVKGRSPHAVATETTLMNLRMHGRPDHDYELHLPLVIQSPAKWHKLIPLDDRFQFRSFVMNHILNAPLEAIDDAKVFRVGDKVQNHGIFSTAKSLPYHGFL